MATATKKSKTTKAAEKAKAEVVEVEETAADTEEVTDEPAKAVDPNMIKKKDIYDHVTVSTGLRKRDVREAVDSLLEYLNKCLAEGKTVQIPPLGKIRSIERGSGENVKLHYKLNLKNNDEAEKKASEVKMALEASANSV